MKQFFHALALLTLSVAPALASDVFDLSPDAPGKVRREPVEAAIAAIPAGYSFANPGYFTVATTGATAPLSTYATDAKTLVGAEPDVAQLVADGLGLELRLEAVAWPDWPLGIVSGKYDAVISNVGVTEERKEKYDFSSYRQGLHGFYVKQDSPVTSITEPADIAGLRIIVGVGTNQERILREWDAINVKAGLAGADLQSYDEEATRLLSLQSGRADVIVQPRASLIFIAARDRNIREVGTLSAGWPERSDVAVVTRKGSGLADPVSKVLNASIEDGSLAKVLARWGLEDEILPRSEVNPRGLPKY